MGKTKYLGLYYDETAAARAFDAYVIANKIDTRLNFSSAPGGGAQGRRRRGDIAPSRRDGLRTRRSGRRRSMLMASGSSSAPSSTRTMRGARTTLPSAKSKKAKKQKGPRNSYLEVRVASYLVVGFSRERSRLIVSTGPTHLRTQRIDRELTIGLNHNFLCFFLRMTRRRTSTRVVNLTPSFEYRKSNDVLLTRGRTPQLGFRSYREHDSLKTKYNKAPGTPLRRASPKWRLPRGCVNTALKRAPATH